MKRIDGGRKQRGGMLQQQYIRALPAPPLHEASFVSKRRKSSSCASFSGSAIGGAARNWSYRGGNGFNIITTKAFHRTNRLSQSYSRNGTKFKFQSVYASPVNGNNDRFDNEDSNTNDASRNVDNRNSNTNTSHKKKSEFLLQYVRDVQPTLIDQFVQHAPSHVVDAMRETISNMIGTLPAQFFEVTVTTVAENLAQLMFSVMMTGYMFRNAQVRLELRQSLLGSGSVIENNNRISNSSDSVGSVYAPGTQKTNVDGEVLRWNLQDEAVESIDAKEYIASLENEVVKLRKEMMVHASSSNSGKVSDGSSGTGNELLNYIKSLEPQNLQELTSMANDDVLEAMNSFIKRLMASNHTSSNADNVNNMNGVNEFEMQSAISETTATELGKLLYWLMVVGYSLRSLEVRLDMGLTLGADSATNGSPLGKLPGEQ